MSYQSHATIKANASKARLHSLIQSLQTLGCTVEINQVKNRIDFELSDHDLPWTLTGNINTIFLSHDDVVTWGHHFHKNTESPAHRPEQR